MTSILALLAVGLVVAAFLHRREAGLGAFLLAVLCAPRITFGELSVRVEHVLVPALLVLVLARGPGRLRVPRTALWYAGFWTWLFGVTAFGYMFGIEAPFWFNLYALVRPAVLLVVVYNLARASAGSLRRYARWMVVMALPLAGLSLAQALGFGPAMWLTLEGYMRPGDPMAAALLGPSGELLRSASVFEGPVDAAVYFLLALGTGLLFLLDPELEMRGRGRLWLFLGVVGALVGGVFTYSATFVAGTVVLMGWLFWRLRLRQQLRLSGWLVLAAAVLIPFLAAFARDQGYLMAASRYQVERVFSITMFETRYDPTEGLLAGTMEAVLARPVTGWGIIARHDVFRGDSMYVLLAHDGGAVGLALFLVVLGSVVLALRGLGADARIVTLWLVLLLATGVGTPSYVVPRVQDSWWLLVGLALGLAHRRRAAGDRLRGDAGADRARTGPDPALAASARAAIGE